MSKSINQAFPMGELSGNQPETILYISCDTKPLVMQAVLPLCRAAVRHIGVASLVNYFEWINVAPQPIRLHRHSQALPDSISVTWLLPFHLPFSLVLVSPMSSLCINRFHSTDGATSGLHFQWQNHYTSQYNGKHFEDWKYATTAWF